MTRWVALLRAINVGGRTVKMDRLRALFEELRYANVETFIASGNVLFDTAEKSGTGYGLIGDIIIGIVGAFVGGFLFRQLGVTSPFGGLAGTIFVAFCGAVVLLFVLRLLRRGGKP